jgi:spore germination cell wall hydrolase CwlJ-like protein
MLFAAPARPSRRTLLGAAAFASLVGLAMGCAYLGGSMAKAMTVTADARRLAGAAEARFSNESVIAASGTDASAMDIAARHDPYLVAGDAQRDRQATLFAAKLVVGAPRVQPNSLFGLRKASFTTTAAAQPFRMGGALDASRDVDCLTQAVYFEARGEGTAGMQAVAQVVLNRARHPAFPKSVCGVVFQGAAGGGCQFSFACDGSMHRGVEADAWRRSHAVATRALSGYVMSEVGNATHFHTTAVQPGWRSNMLRIAQVGSHVFYRFGGSAGSPDAFRYAPKPSTGSIEASHPVMAGFIPANAADLVTKPYKILFKGADEAPAPKAEETAKPAEAPKVEAVAAKPAEAAKP